MARGAAGERQEGTAEPLLTASGLVKAFGGLAVDGVSIALARGEMVGLIGPNGAGKTTLFNLLAGTLKPTAGEIRLAGVDIAGERAEQRIARGIGRTFQIPRPFPAMTVLENVLTGAQKQSGERLWMNLVAPRLIAAEERAAVDKARRLLDFVTLSRLEHAPAAVLSGGQRKLLELARLLMAEPALLLLDEPAAGVNPALLELIIARVEALNREGRTVLLIEHNMEMVARLCRRVVVMAQGRLLAAGRPAEIARDPAVVEAYLGGAQ